jgi:hypothetical protein
LPVGVTDQAADAVAQRVPPHVPQRQADQAWQPPPHPLRPKLLKPLRVLKISNQRVDVKEKVRPNGVRAAIADPRYLAVDDAETLRGQK